MLANDTLAPERIAPLPALCPELERSRPVRVQYSWLTGRPVVLVVDDDEDARETVAVMLGRQDISVIQAATGEAALTVAAAFPVTAIILDVLLPDWTGFDICRMLRAGPTTRDIPIIMLTALTGLAEEITGVLAGASAFLVKPVSRELLLGHLLDQL